MKGSTLTSDASKQTLVEQKSLISHSYIPVTGNLNDIDHFKCVNDVYGHNIGDDVIRLLAENIKQGSRASDLIYRTGGEELLALLPDTDMTQAADIAEWLRKKWKKCHCRFLKPSRFH
ncbi:GGDEF domain-containing protein [Pectobacterium quasiaquaticum]|uniref:GGDEF domain-containing protein n=1 Tax=Pectobacterium quasiaquaticum TaxID=2774015 RepID=UPI002020849F|nr:GGDEF domain-containing protein [Pectobacterium quasiaquaticum]